MQPGSMVPVYHKAVAVSTREFRTWFGGSVELSFLLIIFELLRGFISPRRIDIFDDLFGFALGVQLLGVSAEPFLGISFTQ